MEVRRLKYPSNEDRDKLFDEKRELLNDFDFGADTAAVFDDMLDRSVPCYREMQRMVAELAVDFATEGSCVWDLGCSTCNSFLAIGKRLPSNFNLKFVGIDSSVAMLERAKAKLSQEKFEYDYELKNVQLDGSIRVENASVTLLVLTLQFVRPFHREQILKRICEGLNEKGCLILIEKVVGEDSLINRLFIEHYYEFKRRRGYSELEISQKREVLENVLVPYRHEENADLLTRAGFRSQEVFFRWYNFCATIAIK